MIYNIESDSYLVIRESEYLELQHPIISIFGRRFLNIYFIDLLFSRAHILRTLLYSGCKVLNVLFLFKDFAELNLKDEIIILFDHRVYLRILKLIH